MRYRVLGSALLPLLVFAFACGEDDPVDPDPCESANPPASCEEPEPDGYAFIYEPPAGAPAITSMVLRGTFNNWGPPNGTDIPFTLRDDGSWAAYVELDSATTYEYKFVINGQWIADMCDDPTWGHEEAGGFVHLEADGCVGENSNAVIVLADVGIGFSHSPGDPVHVSVANDTLSIRFRARRDRVLSARVMSEADTSQMYVQLVTGLDDVWRGALPVSTGSYIIEIVTADGPEGRGPYAVPADLFRSVPWVSDAVGYQIFPDRFWNGDPSNDSLALTTDEFHYNDLWTTNGPTLASSWDAPPNNQHCCHQYFGGDIQGIIDRMNYLVELGVTTLYMNPIWHSGSAHGYDAFDYRILAPEFGDSTTLRTFLDLAHANGIRVLWDFVPNHTGLGFWAFQDAVANGPASPYWDWYNFHPVAGLQPGDGRDYDGWFGIASLPQLQTANDEVTAHLLGVATDWTTYGFDGIRVDVPIQLGERDPTFFPEFRSTLKAIDPDVYLVGEVWDRNPGWVQGDQFDALMNYWVSRDAVAGFAQASRSPANVWGTIVDMHVSYPEASTAMSFNLTASHDTGRLLTLLGGGGTLTAMPDATAISRQKLAAALQYALPGIPVTYYGDECAMTGAGPEQQSDLSRRRMDWDRCAADTYGMRAHYTQLASLKRDLEGLGSSVVRQHAQTASLLSFFRGEPGAGEVLVVFNQSAVAQTLTLPAGTWSDAVEGGSLTGAVPIAAYGWRYLVRQ
ncbi:MAG TPA: alpha-amylase family glycosyl hydrolase [Longimicrobiales bacterium]